jgi:hypothetical protein
MARRVGHGKRHSRPMTKRSTLTPLSKPGKRIGSPVKDEPRKMTGIWATLSPEQKLLALSYDGPDLIGDPTLFRRQTDEAEHFYLCPTCGQAVDMRDLAQVFYHDEEGHRRLGRES